MLGKLIILMSLIILPLSGQKNIHDRWDNELKKYVSYEGRVNYKKWRTNKHGIKSYIEALQQNPPKKYWSKNEILSYWINAYNALTVLLVLDNYPLESIKKIKNPWNKKVFSINEINYSLSEIEHNILRKMDEPRIHFAINCASISCPNLSYNAYKANKLETQLEISVKNFLTDKSKNVFRKIKLNYQKYFFGLIKILAQKNLLLSLLIFMLQEKFPKKLDLSI